MQRFLQTLFDNNQKWAERMHREHPGYFSQLAQQQTPHILWIGCSDSRVPSNEIVGMMPGEMFVHRNVANLVIHTDLSSLSVIQYAVEVLKVKHIIICGHYDCGGVKAAMEAKEHGLIDNWLRHIRDVYRFHRREIEAPEDEQERIDRLCECNVREQVSNLTHTTIVQNAWKKGHELAVHGWIYRIETGRLKDLEITVTRPQEIMAIHRIR